MRDEGVEMPFKLWGEKADLSITFADNIILTNMTVSLYEGVMSLNSIDLTDVEVYYKIHHGIP